MLNFKNSVILHEAEKSKHKPNIILQILIFIIVYFVSQLISGIILGVPIIIKQMTNPQFMGTIISNQIVSSNDYIQLLMSSMPNLMLINLYGTIITSACIIVYVKFIEGRSLRSMGFTKTGCFKNYGKGLIIGIVLMEIAVALDVALGGASFSLFNAQVSVPVLLLFFFGYLFQGASEEILCRGYLMVSCTNTTNATISVIISSVVFAALHLFNPGITMLAFINIALFGALAGFYILRTDNIWGACAIHSIWNFLQGNIFGISVSGSGLQESLFVVKPIYGKSLINGGEFGIEGGICTTVVMIIGIALILFIPQKPRPEIIDNQPQLIEKRDNMWNVYKQ